MPTNHPIRRPSGFIHTSHVEPLESRRLLAGTGLHAEYFDNADFTSPVIQRTEAINFDWQSGAPAAGMGADTFSVRWRGLIEPEATGLHTFHLTADDGARLWIDGQLVIDAWNSSAATGTINLTLDKKVAILVEYRENTGDAAIRLEWSAPGLARQLVPSRALFQQQHNSTPLKIIALGDSVTEGDTNHASYRFWLHQSLLGAGYNIDFVGLRYGNHVQYVGTNGNALYPWFDQDHQSRWGGHLDELHASMSQWAALAPDVALIHIGHNDIRGGESPGAFISALGAFIDDLRTYRPNIKIALAKPIKNTSLSHVAEMDAYRAMIPNLVAQKNTAQSPVIVVDQYAGFNPDTDTYDNVHPDAVGEKKVAAKFFAAIQALVGPAALVAKTTTPPPPPPPVLADLSGFVFNDANGDGVRDAGDTGLAGRFVYLDFNNNAIREANEPIVVTNANGRYLFKSLAAGNYRVRHHIGVQPMTGTSPANHQHIARIGAVSGQSTFDFGVRSAVTTIRGNIFFDANNNGTRDAGEKGIANRYVFLDDNNNGIFEPYERFTVTDANGDYVFSNLKPGLYRVRPVIGAAVFVTQPATWGYWVTLSAGDTADNRHFGLHMR